MKMEKHVALTYPWSIKAPIAIFACVTTMLLAYTYVEIISIHETLSKHFMARAMMCSKGIKYNYSKISKLTLIK